MLFILFCFVFIFVVASWSANPYAILVYILYETVNLVVYEIPGLIGRFRLSSVFATSFFFHRVRSNGCSMMVGRNDSMRET